MVTNKFIEELILDATIRPNKDDETDSDISNY